MDTEALIVMALIGIAAGWLASRFIGGKGLGTYLVSGVLGSFVGSFLFDYFEIDFSLGNALVTDIIIATIGAIVVVLAARMIRD